MKKIFYTLMLIISIILSYSVIAHANETANGTCGDGLTWEFDGIDTLTIDGTGYMTDFYTEITPWDNYKEIIETIIIEDSVKSIGSRAFKNCVNLQRLTIGTNVEKIGSGAFRGCTSLRRIYWNAINVADFEVSNGVFYEAGIDSTGIRVEFGNEVLYIPNYAFYPGFGDASYTPNVTRITFGENIIHIGKSAFSKCANIRDIEIPDKVETIGEHAFSDCLDVTSLTLGKAVKDIDAYAFYNCTGVEEIIWRAENVEDKVTPFHMSFASVGREGNGIELTFEETVKVIPSRIFAAGNLQIENYCNIVKVNIKNSVTSIEDNAFYMCLSLEEVVIESGENDLIIAYQAFAECEGLTKITIPKNVVEIHEETFLLSPSVTIYGYDGSYAQSYANQYDIPFVVIDTKTPAEKLCDLINAEKSNSCEVDVETQTVTLLSDVSLSQTLQIPTEVFITLDIGEFDITGADDCDAINIPEYAIIKIIGTGTIKGGNVTLNGYNGGKGITNEGILYLWGPTVMGGDALYYTDDYTGELVEFGCPGAGVSTYATPYTYFIEGMIIAGKGTYYWDTVDFERGALSVIKESDDGENYTVASELYSYKKYLKAIKISNDLTASEKLVSLLNEIQPGTCVLDDGLVTLNKDFSCPYEIIIPSGDQIVLNLNRFTITTDDFFVPFILSTNTNITLTGGGTITNKERPSGSSANMGGGAALLTNEGKLTIEGTTVIGNGINGIYNEGELIVNRGTIIVTDAYNAKDAIINNSDGTITVNGGKIIGGNATGDGKDGGNGISSMQSSVILDGNYPIKLNGGELIGGLGKGDGENGVAIRQNFNVGENYNAYESNDGNSYSLIDGFGSDMRYVKILSKNNSPEIEVVPGGSLGTGTSSYTISISNISFDGVTLTGDLVLSTTNTISGKIYVGVYENNNLTSFVPYTAKEDIPLSVNCKSGQKIKIFWWNEDLIALSLPAEINV